jgi:hypothetical protein
MLRLSKNGASLLHHEKGKLLADNQALIRMCPPLSQKVSLRWGNKYLSGSQS